jgi:hypothetical protein
MLRHHPFVAEFVPRHVEKLPTLGIALMGIKHREFHHLIADRSGAAIHGPRDQAFEHGLDFTRVTKKLRA